MDSMMMAPAYAWWHDFYECKSRFNEFMKKADHLIKTGQKAYVCPTYPNTGENTTKPPKLFDKLK